MQKQALKKKKIKQPIKVPDCMMDISHVLKCLAESGPWPIDYRRYINDVIFSEMMMESVFWPRLSNTYSNTDQHRGYPQSVDSPNSSPWTCPQSRWPDGTPLHARGSSTAGPQGWQHLVLPAPCQARGNSEQEKSVLIADRLCRGLHLCLTIQVTK